MHIPPRSPVWTYQNQWSEEEGPPGESESIRIMYYNNNNNSHLSAETVTTRQYYSYEKISYLNFKKLFQPKCSNLLSSKPCDPIRR